MQTLDDLIAKAGAHDDGWIVGDLREESARLLKQLAQLLVKTSEERLDPIPGGIAKLRRRTMIDVVPIPGRGRYPTSRGVGLHHKTVGLQLGQVIANCRA